MALYESFVRTGSSEQAAGNFFRELARTNPELLDDILLNWIYDQAGGSTTAYVKCEQSRLGIEQVFIDQALRRLEKRKLVRCVKYLRTPHGAEPLPERWITDSGVSRAQGNHRDFGKREYRDRAARNAVLGWLYQQPALQPLVRLEDFLNSSCSVVRGHFLSRDDLSIATSYLSERGLIHCVGPDQVRSLAHAELTTDGIDCVEQGGDVAEYVKGSRDKVSYTFHGSISGNNINVGGYKATQIAASQGIDAGGLSLLMQAVIEALPSLNLSPGNQEDAKYAAGQVVSEVQDPRPDHSRLRAALRALQSALISSTQQALAAVLRAVIDHELTLMGLPPGGLIDCVG